LQCVVANINGDDKKNAHINIKYGVTAFPTFKFFSKDNVEPEEYDGERNEEEIVAYLNEKCNTHRAVGGGLNDQVCSISTPRPYPKYVLWLTGFMFAQAGRYVELDTLAQKFYTAPASARDSLYSEALEIVATADSAAKHYVRVMEKLANGSAGYIEKETKRYAVMACRRHLRMPTLFFPNRLESILTKRNLAPAKLDELKIKVNILKSFVASKETISREETEL
jgi:protein disulfide-isomerase A6